MNNIRIETSIHGDLIVQEVSDPAMRWTADDRRRLIARDVMNTKDAQVREALIRMGWTPPPDKPDHKFKGLEADAMWMDEAGSAGRKEIYDQRT